MGWEGEGLVLIAFSKFKRLLKKEENLLTYNKDDDVKQIFINHDVWQVYCLSSVSVNIHIDDIFKRYDETTHQAIRIHPRKSLGTLLFADVQMIITSPENDLYIFWIIFLLNITVTYRRLKQK